MPAGHPQLPEAQTSYDRIEQEQATALVPKRGGHLFAAFLDLLEGSFNDSGRANVLPMQLGKGVERQAGLPRPPRLRTWTSISGSVNTAIDARWFSAAETASAVRQPRPATLLRR